MTGNVGPAPGGGRSWFVRSVPQHPERFVPVRAEEEGPRTAEESALVRQMPVEPAPFAVGLDAFTAIEEREEPHRRAGLPPLPASDFEHAPFDVERYLGRVEEIGASGTVIATLWEVPSGRSGTASFTTEDTRFEPEAPRPGALLYVWAWSERSDEGQPETRKLVRVENPRLTDDERAELRTFLSRAEKEGP